MNVILALIKKEIIESYRTHKFISLIVLFLFIGFMSPLTAKFTPLILKSIAKENINISAAKPSEIDSWIQFFKNINQVGMFGLAIVLSTQLANEFQRGTIVNLLSKGLPRYQIILSKLIHNAITWVIVYLGSFFLAYVYTNYLFGISFPAKNIMLASLLPLIFGLFLITIEILGGIITGNAIGTLIFVSGSIVIQFILSIKVEIVKYMPIALLGKPINLVRGIGFNDYTTPIIATSIIIVFSTILSVFLINRKQIG